VSVYEENGYLLAYVPDGGDLVRVLRACKTAGGVEDCYWLEYKRGDLRVVRFVDRSGRVEVKLDLALDALTLFNGDPWFVQVTKLESSIRELGVYRTIAAIIGGIAEKLALLHSSTP
jgi:hypothetical protein